MVLLQQKIESCFLDREQLVGQTIFLEQELAGLKEHCKSVLLSYNRGSVRSIPQNKDQVVFVTVCQIAKNWDSQDGDSTAFWNFVCTELGLPHSQKIEKYFRGAIRGLRNKILIATNQKLYYTTVLMHSLAPKKSIFALYELAYKAFKKDLNFSYKYSMQCPCFANSLALKLRGDIDSDQVVGQSFGIAIVELAKTNVATLANILHNIFISINSLYTQDSMTTQDTYLDVTIAEWWQDRQQAKKRKQQEELTSLDSDSDYNKRDTVQTKFAIRDGTVFFDILPIQLSQRARPKLELFVDKQQNPILSKDLRFFDYDEYRETKIFSIDLAATFDSIDFKVVISYDNHTIYDRRIERQFVLFNQDKECKLEQHMQSGHYFLFCYDIDSFQSLPDQHTQCGKYLYQIGAKSGQSLICQPTYIQFDAQNLDETGQELLQLIGNKPQDAEYHTQEKVYTVYTSTPNLTLQNRDTVGLSLLINGQRTLLTQMPNQIYDTTTTIQLPIQKNQPTVLQVYDNKKEKYILEQNIILFDGLKVQYDKPLYWDSQDNFVKIVYNSIQTTQSFGYETQVLIAWQQGQLVLAPPWLGYKLDSEDLQIKSKQDIIWYQDTIKNGTQLQLSIPKTINDAKLFADTGSYSQIQIAPNGQANLGEFVYQNIGIQKIMFFVKIDTRKYDLFTISTDDHFLQPPITKDDGILYWDAQDKFVGKSQGVSFEIELKSTTQINSYQDGQLGIGQIKNQKNFEDLQLNQKKQLTQQSGHFDYKVYKVQKNIFTTDKKQIYKGKISVNI